jgi:transposase
VSPRNGRRLTLRERKWRRFRAWIFTAVRSRHRFVYPTFEETTARAIEACEAAWEFFGGIFKVLIPDNTKAIVISADPLAPRLTPAFLEYAQVRHFHIDPARVRSPRDGHRHVEPGTGRMARDLRRSRAGAERHRSLHEQRVRPGHRG